MARDTGLAVTISKKINGLKEFSKNGDVYDGQWQEGVETGIGLIK